MDEYFEWRADRSGEDSPEEDAVPIGKEIDQPVAVPAYIEDLAERQFHTFRELVKWGVSMVMLVAYLSGNAACHFSPQDPLFYIMSVAKTIEILAEGDSIEEATEEAVREASNSVQNVNHVYVDDYRAVVKNGEIEKYRVNAKVTFVVES